MLLVSRSEMDQAIAKRLDLGRELLDRRVVLSGSPFLRSDDLDSLRGDFNTWDEYNEQLLASRFSTAKVANGYRRVVVGFGGSDNPRRLLEKRSRPPIPHARGWLSEFAALDP